MTGTPIKCAAIVGPTASGKTALGISLAKRFGAEIISCDSMQIYRGMDIGTAKATPRERSEVRHHLIDFLSPDESYSAEAYREDAISAISDIRSRRKLPIFVGGTGLYLDTLLRTQQGEVPPSDPAYRERILEGIGCDADITALWERLLSVDPESAEKIHKNNVKRVIRALEVYDKTGKPKAYWDKMSRECSSGIDMLLMTLDFHNRDLLYSRIDSRVDMMIHEGLCDEVRTLYEAGYLRGADTASAAIGYKEMLSYIKGECTKEAALESIKLATRRYAKRQLTWFRHERDAVTIFVDTEDGKLRELSDICSEAGAALENFLEEKPR